MIAIGTDIVATERIAQGIERGGSAFLDRTFTAAEQAAAASHALPSSFYAKGFAAKEAVFKTLHPSWESGIEMHEIEILERENGQPCVVLHGNAKLLAEAAGAKDVLISVSFDGDYAVAFAVLT